MEDEPMHKASHRRRVEVELNKANRARDRKKPLARRQNLPRRELPAGSSSPKTKPVSTADPSPIRPALQPLSTITQFTAMSATRNSRVYRRGH